MQIRPMEIEDLEQVMIIENETFSVPWTETGFFTFLIRNDTLFLVAQENEAIVGYAGIVMVPEDGDITNVAVKASMRGQGIGQKLVKELLIRAEEQGVRNVFLEVRESNKPAISLYEKQGFVSVSVRKDYYEEPKENAIVMKYTKEA